MMPPGRELRRRAVLGGGVTALLTLRFGVAISSGTAASEPLSPAEIAQIRVWHVRFTGARRWRLTTAGIEQEGTEVLRTSDPDDARRALLWFPEARLAAVEFGVPLELILATLVAESVGAARTRAEAARARGTSGEVGAMQTLPATARMALGWPRMPVAALTDPLTSVRAGTAYIALGRPQTGFDPPLTAACYNAGSVRFDRSQRNPWRLVCWPPGTGGHVTRFSQAFGDALALLRAEPGLIGVAPSFSAMLADH